MKLICQAISLIALTFLAAYSPMRAADRAQYVNASNRSNCKISDPYYDSGDRLEWSGKCENGFARGGGSLKRYNSKKTLVNENQVWLDAKGAWQGHALFYMYINGQKVLIYDGDLKNGVYSGMGEVYMMVDGFYWLVYEGSNADGKANGHGVVHYRDGGKYEGGMVNGARSGFGRLFDSGGVLVYDGQWLNDKWNGRGTQYVPDGFYNVGTWTNGVRDAGIIQYSPRGEPIARWNGEAFDDIRSKSRVAPDSSDDEDGDQPQQSTGSQIANGLLQGMTRGVGTYQTTRAPVVAARAQAAYASAAAQRAQASAAALALAQQQAQQTQARQNSGYSQPASQVLHSQDATSCISVSDNLIHNRCGTAVSVVWCVQGDYSDCNRGYDNESDISAGGQITALPLRHPGTTIKVNYSACTGSNTATAHGWSVKCD